MRRFVSGGLTAAVIVQATLMVLSATPAVGAPPRSFTEDSYWNKALPSDAPLHPNSQQIIGWIKADNGNNFVTMAGTGSTGAWGQPIFWAKPDDPVYEVVQTRYTLPHEFKSLRIPREAQPDPTVDAEFTVYDLEAGLVSTLHRAEYDATTDTWSAGGAAVYYLGSNGIDGKLPQSNEPRNFGHRGLPPPTYAVRYDHIQSGAINEVLKVAINNTRAEAVYPMSGHEHNSTHEYAPAEGARIRIKPSVDLEALGLTPAALVVARALQRYGAIIGDQSGGNVVMKVENTVAQGQGHLWKGVLNGQSLSAIPLDMYEVVEYGYEPAESAPVSESPVVEESTEPEVTVPKVSKPKVRVVKPRRKFVRVNRRVRIVWRSNGADTRFARIRYRVRGGGQRVIRRRTPDNGRFVWKPPPRLRGKRLRIIVQVVNTQGDRGGARSRWMGAR